MRKRIFALGLSILMATSITACGGNNDSEMTEKTTEAKKTEAKKDSVEEQLKALEGTPLTEAMDKIKELGYTGKYYADGEDFTDFIDSLKDDYTTGEVKVDTDSKEVEVTLELTSNIKADDAKDALSEKFYVGDAWTAASKYGQQEYGDGFELHYLKGKIAEEAQDENTWFLKAECTLDGEDMTCEATVTGTSENPEVTEFNVY